MSELVDEDVLGGCDDSTDTDTEDEVIEFNIKQFVGDPNV